MTNHPNPAPGDPSPQQPSNPYVQHLQQHMAVGQGQNPTVPFRPPLRAHMAITRLRLKNLHEHSY